MPKADLVLANGTKVTIEGATDEVAALLVHFSGSVAPVPSRNKRRKPNTSEPRPRSTAGPVGLIAEFANEDYFSAKRTIGDVQKKLEERGHVYALTSISPALFRLTRKRTIRRVKEGRVWMYVK